MSNDPSVTFVSILEEHQSIAYTAIRVFGSAAGILNDNMVVSVVLASFHDML